MGILLNIGDKCSRKSRKYILWQKYDQSPFPLNFDTVHCPWTQNPGRWHPLGQGSRGFLSILLPQAPLCLPGKTYDIGQNTNKYICLSEVEQGFLSILDNENQALYLTLALCFKSKVTWTMKFNQDSIQACFNSSSIWNRWLKFSIHFHKMHHPCKFSEFRSSNN